MEESSARPSETTESAERVREHTASSMERIEPAERVRLIALEPFESAERVRPTTLSPDRVRRGVASAENEREMMLPAESMRNNSASASLATLELPEILRDKVSDNAEERPEARELRPEFVRENSGVVRNPDNRVRARGSSELREDREAGVLVREDSKPRSRHALAGRKLGPPKDDLRCRPLGVY